MKKWIIRITLGLAVFLIVALVIVWMSLDGIVRYGVERGATQATGQTTTLKSASLSLSEGSIQLTGLDIANPPTYSKSPIISMKQCTATANIKSLLTNDIVVPTIDIDGLEVSVEQSGLKTNLQEVLGVSQTTTPAAGGSSAPTPPGKNIHIGVIKLTNVVVHIHAVAELTLDLGTIEIKDPTNADGRPMKMADVVANIIVHVAQQVANDPRIPLNLKDGLSSVKSLVTQFGDLLNGQKGPATDTAKKVGDTISNFFNKKK